MGLGHFWDIFGVVLGVLGFFLVGFRNLGGELGSFWVILGHFWHNLGPFGVVLGLVLQHFHGNLLSFSPSTPPKMP